MYSLTSLTTIYIYDTELKKLQLYLNLISFIMVKGSISISILLQVIITALDHLHFYDTFLVWMFLPCLAKVSQILIEANTGSVCIQTTQRHILKDALYLFVFTKICVYESLRAEADHVLQ